MCISKSIKPTIVTKIIRRSMRQIDRKPVFLYVNNEICLLLEQSEKKSCFCNNVTFDVDQYFLLNVSFITIIQMYENKK